MKPLLLIATLLLSISHLNAQSDTLSSKNKSSTFPEGALELGFFSMLNHSNFDLDNIRTKISIMYSKRVDSLWTLRFGGTPWFINHSEEPTIYSATDTLVRLLDQSKNQGALQFRYGWHRHVKKKPTWSVGLEGVVGWMGQTNTYTISDRVQNEDGLWIPASVCDTNRLNYYNQDCGDISEYGLIRSSYLQMGLSPQIRKDFEISSWASLQVALSTELTYNILLSSTIDTDRGILDRSVSFFQPQYFVAELIFRWKNPLSRSKS